MAAIRFTPTVITADNRTTTMPKAIASRVPTFMLLNI